MADSTKIAVRQASEPDLPQLLSLYDELHPDDHGILSVDAASTIWQRMEKDDGYVVLVAEIGDQLAASVSLVVIANLTRGGRPYALIENVITSGRYRRQGLATKLLRTATVMAEQKGCYKVMLLTGQRDADTLEFYANAGFEQSKTGFQLRFT